MKNNPPHESEFRFACQPAQLKHNCVKDLNMHEIKEQDTAVLEAVAQPTTSFPTAPNYVSMSQIKLAADALAPWLT